MLLQEQNMTLMVKERKNCHSVLGKFFDQLPKGNSLASGDGFWVQLTAVMRVLFRLITSRLEICVLFGIVILEGPQNKANRDSCLSHQFFPISVISFLKGESKTLLNTQEENLTVDITSVIMFLWLQPCRAKSYSIVFEYLKPWSKGPASSRKWMQVELAQRLVFGGQMHSQVSSQVQASHQKKHFKGNISCISLAKNRLMDVTQLALTWVGWPNGEKPALTCVQI